MNDKKSSYDSTVVYLKKWSFVGKKLVFKLNTKMMQIICGKPNKNNSVKKPETTEILFKYDSGQIVRYTCKGRSQMISVSKNDKKVIFSNSKSLDEKLRVIENLVTDPVSEIPDETPIKYSSNKNLSSLNSRYDTTTNEKSIFGFTPMNCNQNQKSTMHKSRYQPRSKRTIYETHQSLNYTPFKDLTTKTSAYTGNITTSNSKAQLYKGGSV